VDSAAYNLAIGSGASGGFNKIIGTTLNVYGSWLENAGASFTPAGGLQLLQETNNGVANTYTIDSTSSSGLYFLTTSRNRDKS